MVTTRLTFGKKLGGLYFLGFSFKLRLMITIKSDLEIEKLQEGGRRLAKILSILSDKARPGVSAFELDKLAFELIVAGGDTPSFLNYQPKGSRVAYPSTLCVSINDAVVHGIPGGEGEKILKSGDIVGIDMGIIHDGLITDSAVTVGVGKIDSSAKQLLKVTKQALDRGIKAAKAGATVGDIGYAIEQFVKPFGYGIIRELAGHGVGYKVHEDPFVPNYGKAGEGPKLVPGMVIAIEPMLNEGDARIKLDADGFTYRTLDGKRSAHFEHTVVITTSGARILTKL